MAVPNSVAATEDVVDLAETVTVVVDAEMDEAVDAVRAEDEVLLGAAPHAARAPHRDLNLSPTIITDRQTTPIDPPKSVRTQLPFYLDSYAPPFSERFPHLFQHTLHLTTGMAWHGRALFWL